MTTPAPSKSAASSLGLKVSGSAKTAHVVEFEREDALEQIFGTEDRAQASALLSHVLKVLGPNEAGDAGEANDERYFILSIVKDLAPRDAIERMLAVQMAAVHVATVRSAGSLARADILPRIEAHSTALNKLARTFATQVEALRKHRTGGRQTVVVQHQHVTVEDGGQAIVGHVQTGARDRGVGQP